MGDYPGLSLNKSSVITSVLLRKKRQWSHNQIYQKETEIVLNGATSQEYRWPLEAEKGKKMGSSLETLERIYTN